MAKAVGDELDFVAGGRQRGGEGHNAGVAEEDIEVRKKG